MIEYAEASVAALNIVLGQAKDGAIPHAAIVPVFPVLPIDVMVAFQNIIETSDESIGDPFAMLLIKIQIHASRVRGIQSRINGDPSHIVVVANIESSIIDVGGIYARTGALFEYARRAKETVPNSITMKSIREALNLMGINAENHERLYRTLDLYEKAGHLP